MTYQNSSARTKRMLVPDWSWKIINQKKRYYKLFYYSFPTLAFRDGTVSQDNIEKDCVLVKPFFYVDQQTLEGAWETTPYTLLWEVKKLKLLLPRALRDNLLRDPNDSASRLTVEDVAPHVKSLIGVLDKYTQDIVVRQGLMETDI